MFPLCCSGVLKTKEVKLRVWLPHRGVFRGCLFTSDASKKYSKLEPRLFTIIAFFFLPPPCMYGYVTPHSTANA